MDKCPKCGNKLSSIDVLCPKCGALVEVVQIKKGAALQNASSGLGTPIKKLPHQNLIVYNDDWPVDDIDMLSLPDEKPVIAQSNMLGASPPDVVSTLLKRFDAPADPDAYSIEAELGSEENYLAMFRNMKLPELENINTSSPDQSDTTEHTTVIEHALNPEYTEHTDLPEQTDYLKPSDYLEQTSQPEPEFVDPAVATEPTQHRWLEIEELSNGAHAHAASHVLVEASVPDTALADETPRYRYHSKYRQAAATPPPPRSSVSRAVLMVFVWLLITGALFCGFYFLDQYVTQHYGTYQAMLYEWTDGSINLAPSTESSPAPIEAPAP